MPQQQRRNPFGTWARPETKGPHALHPWMLFPAHLPRAIALICLPGAGAMPRLALLLLILALGGHRPAAATEEGGCVSEVRPASLHCTPGRAGSVFACLPGTELLLGTQKEAQRERENERAPRALQVGWGCTPGSADNDCCEGMSCHPKVLEW